MLALFDGKLCEYELNKCKYKNMLQKIFTKLMHKGFVEFGIYQERHNLAFANAIYLYFTRGDRSSGDTTLSSFRDHNKHIWVIPFAVSRGEAINFVDND